MTSAYDPRARRRNPLIDELVATLDEYWDQVTTAADYLERKGRLRAVRGVIDEILAQPEWLEADLQEGAAKAVDCWFLPEEFAGEPGPVFLDRGPFDDPGESGGLCFLYADTGKLSLLYEGEPIDPFIGPLRSHGPYVYTLEKLYATACETVNRVISAHLWEHLVPADGGGAGARADVWVLCDPRGIAGGAQSVCVACCGTRERAVEIAELLSRTIDIRFVVARERRRWCTR